MTKLSLALPLALLLSACGQSGPLVLPDQEPKVVQQAPQPAVAQPETAPDTAPQAPAPAVANPKNNSDK